MGRSTMGRSVVWKRHVVNEKRYFWKKILQKIFETDDICKDILQKLASTVVFDVVRAREKSNKMCHLSGNQRE